MGFSFLIRIAAVWLVVGAISTPGTSRAQLDEPNTQSIVITQGNASPSTLRIPVGASVRWVNEDTKVHELVLEFDDGFVLPLLDLEPGADFTMAFADAESLLFRSVNDIGVSGAITIGTPAPASSNSASPTANELVPTATAPNSGASATRQPTTSTSQPPAVTPPPAQTAISTSTVVAVSTAQSVSASTATVSPTSEASPAASIPTPPPPAAGGLGLVADGGSTGALWLGLVGAAVMALAISALLHSGSRKRIEIEHKPKFPG